MKKKYLGIGFCIYKTLQVNVLAGSGNRDNDMDLNDWVNEQNNI